MNAPEFLIPGRKAYFCRNTSRPNDEPDGCKMRLAACGGSVETAAREGGEEVVVPAAETGGRDWRQSPAAGRLRGPVSEGLVSGGGGRASAAYPPHGAFRSAGRRFGPSGRHARRSFMRRFGSFIVRMGRFAIPPGRTSPVSLTFVRKFNNFSIPCSSQ